MLSLDGCTDRIGATFFTNIRTRSASKHVPQFPIDIFHRFGGLRRRPVGSSRRDRASYTVRYRRNSSEQGNVCSRFGMRIARAVKFFMVIEDDVITAGRQLKLFPDISVTGQGVRFHFFVLFVRKLTGLVDDIFIDKNLANVMHDRPESSFVSMSFFMPMEMPMMRDRTATLTLCAYV